MSEISQVWPRRKSSADRISGLLLPALARRIRFGRLTLRTPGGGICDLGGTQSGPNGELQLHSWRMLWRLISGASGFAEGYLAGEWDSPDLPALLNLLGSNLPDRRVIPRGLPWRRLARAIEDRRRSNSRAGARGNIARHYDLGNDFYRLWLDESLTYSAAIFEGPDEDLQAAQTRKYRRIAELAGLAHGQRILEIGCGWGGFAIWAAREIGCHVTATTISEAQYALAAQRISEAGLGDRVTLMRRDYRDIAGRFDRIVSIEMLEAVGESYWPVFMKKLRESLAPGGRIALQVIVISDKAFPRYRTGVDFIQKHVFPGGMLPAPAVLRRAAETAGLAWRRSYSHGDDYARTLRIWGRNFAAAWPEIVVLGFDERFRRLWQFYLAYCEAGFRIGRIDVLQVALDAECDATATSTTPASAVKQST